jgi:hypothetical protein
LRGKNKMAENGNGKSLIWRSAIGILFAMLSFLSAFMFNKVVALPDTYIKIEAQAKIEDAQNRRQEKLEEKIDTGFSILQQQFTEINQYLRDKAGRPTRPPG